MQETGVIHGRFQVLHNDHVTYLMAGKARCRHLVVGVTNPDPSLTREDPADPLRSHPSANPLTYFERYTMVRSVLVDQGLGIDDFSVVPFPINLPELYRHYVPLDAMFFLTIYDSWGRIKLQKFKCLGLKTEVLWERTSEQKGLSAGNVRSRMVQGLAWEHLVPLATASLMKKWHVPLRLQRLCLSRP
jgi:nicotinamide-nucleotide adenylyltransferase